MPATMSESKTPRTDAATILEPYLVRELSFEVVTTDFARQLETELAASKAREDAMAETLSTLQEMALEHPAFNFDAFEDGDIDAICELGGDTADWTLIGLYSGQALEAWRAAK